MSFEVNSPRGKLTSNGKRENSVVDNSHKVMFEAGGLLPPEVRTGTGNSRHANTPPSMRAAPERIDPFKHRQIRALTNSRDDKAQPKYEIGFGWLAGWSSVRESQSQNETDGWRFASSAIRTSSTRVAKCSALARAADLAA